MKLIVLYYTYCSCVSVYAFFSARCQLIFVFLSCFNETFMWLFYLTARAHHTLLVCISIKKYSMNFSMMFCSAFLFLFQVFDTCHKSTSFQCPFLKNKPTNETREMWNSYYLCYVWCEWYVFRFQLRFNWNKINKMAKLKPFWGLNSWYLLFGTDYFEFLASISGVGSNNRRINWFHSLKNFNPQNSILSFAF